MLYGALEAGGTKMVCAIGTDSGKIIEQISIPTSTPSETMPKIIDYFKEKEIVALGVGSFGPIDLNQSSPTFGYILSTPKLAWANYNLLGTLKNALQLPIGFDTDVNASALGEATFGCTKGLNSSIYITIGTGIGVGVYLNNSLLHGMLHPEAGHILLSRASNDTYRSCCPYHNDCFEGFACGIAIETRFGKKAYELTDNEEVWEFESYYIAQALMNYALTLSPHRIVLGGGVMHQTQLYPLIRKKFLELLNGYIMTNKLKDIDNYIVAPSLYGDQGIMGCIQLAINEYLSTHQKGAIAK